ncbi:MAG: hypothetical protein KC729_21485, partial [Candidatus Eisenbacteria bacterium]|nr:hypothetical protein [Candidatus Eisenbacteria bacterium]
MRSIILWAVLTGLWAGVSFGDELAATASLETHIVRRADGVHVRLRGDLPSDRPIVRLLPLPHDRELPEVRVSPDSHGRVVTGRPFVMRGLALLPIEISRESSDLSETLDFDVQYGKACRATVDEGRALAHS